MSTILGADGKPTTEPEAERPATNGHDKSETRDVRTVPTGVLIFNLCLCANGLQMNKMMLEQVTAEMRQQKIIVDPPQVQQLKAVLEHQYMARDVMVGEINFRFRELDAQRVSKLEMEVVDRTAKEELTPGGLKVQQEPV